MCLNLTKFQFILCNHNLCLFWLIRCFKIMSRHQVSHRSIRLCLRFLYWLRLSSFWNRDGTVSTRSQLHTEICRSFRSLKIFIGGFPWWKVSSLSWRSFGNTWRWLWFFIFNWTLDTLLLGSSWFLDLFWLAGFWNISCCYLLFGFGHSLWGWKYRVINVHNSLFVSFLLLLY